MRIFAVGTKIFGGLANIWGPVPPRPQCRTAPGHTAQYMRMQRFGAGIYRREKSGKASGQMLITWRVLYFIHGRAMEDQASPMCIRRAAEATVRQRPRQVVDRL